MDVEVGFINLMKMFGKIVSHQILQYRLGTYERSVVSTSYGQVRGLKRRIVYEDDFYYAFEGIPFAKPPLGELRFRAPEPPAPWPDVLDCTNYKTKPTQKVLVANFVEGSEDCLYLNVYVKKLKTDKPLPVLVFIHGGGFQVGEASRIIYSPDYFMKKDVVLVTITYRLGALGFLSLKDPDLDVPGNAGLKDQVMALRWIKANIANFNGDTNNITVFGESAGSASTNYLMISDQAKGLFHKAILQSGSALCPWAFGEPRDFAFRLAQKLSFKGSNNDKEVFRFLSNVEAKKIATIDNKILTDDEKREHLIFTFVPVVEPYRSEFCFLPQHPRELMKNAWSNEIPIIIGGNSFEGLFLYQTAKFNPFLVNEAGDCESLLPPEIKKHHSDQELKDMGLKLKKAFFNGRDPSVEETYLEYVDWVSYKYMWHGIYRALLARLAYAPRATNYLYRFDFDSPHFNHFRTMMCAGSTVRGTSHADDLSYLFYHCMASQLPKDSAEYKTIERLIGIWTTFAETSNPNCPPIAEVNWTPVPGIDKNVDLKCLNISEKVEIINLPEREKLKLFDSFYSKEPLY